MTMDLHEIVGTMSVVLVAVEFGWRMAAAVVLMAGFLTLAFALSSNWVVVAVLLVAATTVLRFARRRWSDR
jgi:hypothetical protein